MEQKNRKRFRLISMAGVISIIVLLAALLPLAAMGAESEEGTDKPAADTSAPGKSADSNEELAKATMNPLASMVSLPIQSNWELGMGPADAQRYTMTVKPVIPFSLGSSYNLITRTIVPYIASGSPMIGGDGVTGLGDITQSFFLSPKDTLRGWIVGFGPVFLYPSASLEALGSEKWGAGPTGVVAKQENGFTYGILLQHIWSFAGNDQRAYVSATYLQPFASYTTKTYTSFSVNTESTYDWENSQWTVPINVSVSQMLKIGGQPLSLQLGYCYYAETPDNGPDWGLRFTITFLFPK